MGISYKDVELLNSGIDSLTGALLKRKALEREKSRDQADDNYRNRMLDANQQEAARNAEFRKSQADATKAHYDTIAAQGAERNVLLSADQQARARVAERAQRHKAMQWTIDTLKDGVEKKIIPAETANKQLSDFLAKVPPEELEGTPFEGMTGDFFQPAPEKVVKNPLGEVEETTEIDGRKRVLRRPATESDITPPKQDPWEKALQDAGSELRDAQINGDQKIISAAQAKKDRIEAAMAAEMEGGATVYQRGNGTLQRIGGKPVAPGIKKPTGPAPLPGTSEEIQLPEGGAYKTTAVPWTEHPEGQALQRQIVELTAKLREMGNQAPREVSRPRSTLGSGLPGIPTQIETIGVATPQDRIAHDAKVKEILKSLEASKAKLEILKRTNPAQ